MNAFASYVVVIAVTATAAAIPAAAGEIHRDCAQHPDVLFVPGNPDNGWLRLWSCGSSVHVDGGWLVLLDDGTPLHNADHITLQGVSADKVRRRVYRRGEQPQLLLEIRGDDGRMLRAWLLDLFTGRPAKFREVRPEAITINVQSNNALNLTVTPLACARAAPAG